MKRRKDPGQNAEPELSQRSPDRPDPLAYPDVYPGMFPETEHPVSPEAPPGLDSDAVPIASDSPRRAPDPGRLGNPIKDKMEAQPENSDSPSDDSLMKPRKANPTAQTDPRVQSLPARPNLVAVRRAQTESDERPGS
jgi:hypothetical protein